METTTAFSFQWALERLQLGDKLRRSHWPTSCHVVAEENRVAFYAWKQNWHMNGYYLAAVSDWKPSGGDMIATNWEILKEEE